MISIKKYAGAIALAGALGITGFSALPSQAQGFGFEVSPPGSGFSFGFDVGRPDRYDRDRRYDRCIAQRRLDDAIEDQGYRAVRITDYGRRTTEARGVRGGWLYEIIADTCSGQIIDRDRLRRA